MKLIAATNTITEAVTLEISPIHPINGGITVPPEHPVRKYSHTFHSAR